MIQFIFGLIIGLGFFYWRQSQLNKQLDHILDSLAGFEQIPSLSKVSQIRRTVNLLHEEYNLVLNELELLQKILEKSPLGYLRIDSDNHLIECNKQAKKILSIKRWNPKKSRFFLELIRSYELDQLIQQARKTGQKLSIKWDFFPTSNYILNEEGSDNTLESYEPIYLKAIAFPVVNDEVIILIENRQKIKELSQRRDQAYTDLSHELRTPLTSISLLAETLIKQNGNQKVWAEQIYQEINRLISLVENWLKMVQWDANPYENLQWQKLDLQQLILSSWKSLAILAEKEEINLEFQGLENIIIGADLNCLTQVFVNLFDNSIKHTFPQGLIRVNVTESFYDEQEKVIIDVIDSGTGFNPKDLPHIFERLYRGDKSRARTSREGSGLGLSIVKQIILAHGGSITAKNHPAGGAWFQICLPKNISMVQDMEL